jgi:hypothetical protein
MTMPITIAIHVIVIVNVNCVVIVFVNFLSKIVYSCLNKNVLFCNFKTTTKQISAKLNKTFLNYFLFSVQGGSSVRTYLDCHWITTQILHSHALTIPPDTDLIVGYMFQVNEKERTNEQKRKERKKEV